MKAFDDSALEVATEYEGSSDLGDGFSRFRTSTRDSSSPFGSDSRSVAAKHVIVTPSLTPVQESQSSLDALSQKKTSPRETLPCRLLPKMCPQGRIWTKSAWQCRCSTWASLLWPAAAVGVLHQRVLER
ncbi:hypothetical protein MTO96_025902 [Rhipicephalus appendiculatus]